MTKHLCILLSLLSICQCTAGNLPLDGWSFHKSPEKSGAVGILRHDSRMPFKNQKTLGLSGDFRNGGDFVAASLELPEPKEMDELRIRLRSNASRIEIRCQSIDGQIQRHIVELTGDPSVWQCIELPVREKTARLSGGKETLFPEKTKRISLLLSRENIPGGKGFLRLAECRIVKFDRKPSRLVLPLKQSNWSLNRGIEFAPGSDASLDANGTRLLLKVDNSRHGDYAAAVYRFKLPVAARKIHFKTRGANRFMALRLIDTSRQVHNHMLKTAGKPAEEQEFSFDVTGSKHHWGGKNDGVFHGRLAEIQFVVCGRSFGAARRGETEFSSIAIESNDMKINCPDWKIPDPAALFRHPGDTRPVMVQTCLPDDFGQEKLHYSYRSYTGEEVAAGVGKYDAERGMLFAPPPSGCGFFELVWPELMIRLGVIVDDPPPTAPDEYFGMDSSLSWGAPPSNEEEIRCYMRILKRNGIEWNRDRLNWPQIESRRGIFHFDGRFELYRRIAAEEGIKALDTFHAAPAWNREPAMQAATVQSPYPIDLSAAGNSWNAIVKHWNVIRALEVWNEPDIGFGKSLPAEYVTSLTKAISRTFADNRNHTLVVGGGFASTRPGTNFYRTYIDNGLLDDSDVISFHSYADVSYMEPLVSALRSDEIRSGTPRLGIPYWITESGKPRPWYGFSRGFIASDQYSAVEITGKAVELRALGIQRYFAFEYKFRKENANNFGLMDAKHTPMRNMAAYLHLIRVLSHRTYAGDLEGDDAFRTRVFEGKDDLVAVLYNGVKKTRRREIRLPRGLQVKRATGIDGRPLAVKDGRVSNADGITYLFFDKRRNRQFVNSDTPAMKLYLLAKNYKPMPRAAKPLVLQSMMNLSGLIISNRGFYVPNANDITVKIRVNNFGTQPLSFIPDINLPPGARLLEPSEAITVAALEKSDFSIRIALDTSNGIKFQTLRVGDKNGRATPIAFSLAPFRRTELNIHEVLVGTEKAPAVPDDSESKDWVDFSGHSNWTAWEGDKTIPDIEAKFRSFYTRKELVFQILVKDDIHVNSHSARDSWRGDSVQIAVQQRNENGSGAGEIWEIAAAECNDGQVLYAHRGSRVGLLRSSRLKFRALGGKWYLYEIRLDGKELGLELRPQSTIAASIIVNSGSYTGRNGFLSWGGGIAQEKNSQLFQILHLQ